MAAFANTQIEVRISGMHCAGCVATVESVIRRLPGVLGAAVNLATERATVLVAQSGPTAAEIAEALEKAGYQAETASGRKHALRDRQAERLRLIREQTIRLILAAVLGLPVLWLHLASMLKWSDVAHPPGAVWWQPLLTLAVLIVGAGPMFLGAWRALLIRTGNMDLLVSLGALSAFIAGLCGVFSRRHELMMFDASVMIVLFVGLGKLLEARARGSASATLEALSNRLPETALRLVEGRVEPITLDAVIPGHILRVTAPAVVPVDGEIAAGQLSVDESMLTGESVPLERGVGEKIMGGTQAVGGSADVQVTASGADSAAARIAKLVEGAQTGKPRWQRLADRAAAIFVPVVLCLSAITAIGWMVVGAGLDAALTRAIAVLVVACPCAMGLAIPTAVMVGMSAAGARGILIRNVEALEAAAGVQLVLLDKTGTLTSGNPMVVEAVSAPGIEKNQVVRIAAALAEQNSHPFSQAIAEHARSGGVAPAAVAEGVEIAPGGGVRGIVNGVECLLGSDKWLASRGVTVCDGPDEREGAGQSWVFLAGAGQWLGSFALSDALLPESAAAMADLGALGVQVRILSGDRAAACRVVALQLGIEFEAELSPADKLERVRTATARRIGVAMVGDGVNDAPSLAAADVGIAIGAGADVAREAADVCLVGRSPRRIADAIRVSRATTRVMKQNLIWAAGYNLLMLPLAALAPIPAGLAAAAMMLSSFSVVGNSLRLRSVR